MQKQGHEAKNTIKIWSLRDKKDPDAKTRSRNSKYYKDWNFSNKN
jgi:hypothetical protein